MGTVELSGSADKESRAPSGAYSRREHGAGGGVLVVEVILALPEARGGTGFFGGSSGR
jgi:hypothetical protein